MDLKKRVAGRWRHLWPMVVGVLFSVCCLSYVAWGATYNFYFNNTEQGPNSTATPSLSVTDGKGTGGQTVPGVPGGPAAATENPAAAGATHPAAVASAPAGTGASVATVQVDAPSQAREYRPFRLMFSSVGIWEKTMFSWPGSLPDNCYNCSGSWTSLGGMRLGTAVNLSLFLSRHAAINGFVGLRGADFGPKVFGGAELELMPVHFSLFHTEDFFEAGFLLGASTLAKAPDNIASAHGGVRMNFNINNDWGVTVSGRGNMGYVMADAGVSFRM